MNGFGCSRGRSSFRISQIARSIARLGCKLRTTLRALLQCIEVSPNC